MKRVSNCFHDHTTLGSFSPYQIFHKQPTRAYGHKPAGRSSAAPLGAVRRVMCLNDMSHMYALKSAIEDLLGNRAWLELKESTSTTTWRRYGLKLVNAIELSIGTTIKIKDEDWSAEVHSNLEHGREQGKQERAFLFPMVCRMQCLIPAATRPPLRFAGAP